MYQSLTACKKVTFCTIECLFTVPAQEIDSLLAGGLTAEDEDDVLQELEQIVKVHFIGIQLFVVYSSCALGLLCFDCCVANGEKSNELLLLTVMFALLSFTELT